MWSIKVRYPKIKHIPTNTEMSATSIIPSHLIKLRKIPLTETVNLIFDEKHDEVFGRNAYIDVGAPESVTLIPDKLH